MNWPNISVLHGRLSRKEFWQGMLMLLALGFVLNFAVDVVQWLTVRPVMYSAGGPIYWNADDMRAMEEQKALLHRQQFYFVLTALLWPMMALQARRLRDIEWSPWFAMFSLVPLVSLVIIVACLVVPRRHEPEILGD